jgi:DNA repair ATPase RecN
MLRFLGIQNLAVIESAEIGFHPGLNVLTGRPVPAGRSVEAVGLLLAAACRTWSHGRGQPGQAVFDGPAGAS